MTTADTTEYVVPMVIDDVESAVATGYVRDEIDVDDCEAATRFITLAIPYSDE